MALTRADKKWLAMLAAMLVRALSEVIVCQYKTQVSVERTRDILRYGETDESIYVSGNPKDPLH
jgi:hypothetical protein